MKHFSSELSMDSLLCDEVWLSNPTKPDCFDEPDRSKLLESCMNPFYTTKEDCEHAFFASLEKESRYMPEPGYLEHLLSKNLFIARSRAIQWLIKARRRLNLSFTTVFHASNYLDRFISTNHYHDWKCWMVELLSVACLSLASKFSETSIPSLHEIQMEDLDHSFQSNTIQRMELMVLEALGWRLGSTTAYSFVELLTTKIKSLKFHLRKDLVSRVTELLLRAMLDWKLLEYRPSIAAASAVWCSLEELAPSKSDAYLAYITGFFDQDQKDDLVSCHNIMEARLLRPLHSLLARGDSSYYFPSSPVTVLLKEGIEIWDGQQHVDLSSFKTLAADTTSHETCTKKRKRDGSCQE